MSRINSPHWLNVNGLYRLPESGRGHRRGHRRAAGPPRSRRCSGRASRSTVTQSSNNLGSSYGFDHQRPNLVGDPAGSTSVGGITHGDAPETVTGLINPAAFANAAAFTPGDTPQTLDERSQPEARQLGRLVREDDADRWHGRTCSCASSSSTSSTGSTGAVRCSRYGAATFGQLPGVRGFPRTMQFMAKVVF